MSEQTEALARKRALLQVQCALQRELFVQHAAQVREGLHSANHGLEVVRGLRVMPIIMAATSAAGLISRASGLMRLLGRAWFIISTLRRLQRSPRQEPQSRAAEEGD